MRLHYLMAPAMFAGTLLASGAAMAIPTTTIDGVTIPIGQAVGGDLITTEGSAESLVLSNGDTLQGISKVTQIADSQFNATYNGYGNGNGTYLVSVFQNFKVDTVVAPTVSTPGTITFFGGSLSYYVSNTDNFNVGLGTQSADLTLAESGKLWLALTPAAIDPTGHTLIITIPKNTSLTTFAGAQASAFLDVVGGDAATAFNTNTFVNGFDLLNNGFSDVDFQGTANSSPKGDFPISGSNDLEANALVAAVPEPVSVSLFGGGLAAMGFMVTRRKSKKA